MIAVKDVLDTRLSYAIIFTITYLMYLVNLININNPDKFFIPHPLLLTVILVTGLFLILSMQEINHVDVNYNLIIIWQMLSLIPTALILFYTRRMIKSMKKRNDDVLAILGLYSIYIISSFFTVVLLLVVILVLVINQNMLIFLLPFYSSIGFLGISLGYFLSKIRMDPTKVVQFIQGNIFSPIVGTSTRRMILAIMILVLDFILLILQPYLSISTINL